MNQAVKFSHVPGEGEVYRCKDCENLHLAWKNIAIAMQPGEFIRFSQMIQTAADHPAFGAKLSFRKAEEPLS